MSLLSHILTNPTSYKVATVSGRTINVKLSFDSMSDGINIVLLYGLCKQKNKE